MTAARRNGSAKKVFISYSHADADRAWIRAFAKSLRQQGMQVWLDESAIPAGEPLREAIELGLRESEVFIAIVTPEGIKRPNFLFELGAAVGMGKRVVAILPQNMDPSLLPQPFRIRRFLVQSGPEETAKELLARQAG